ncbi:MAG: polysaccharide lyase, partial [Aeromonas sp.]
MHNNLKTLAGAFASALLAVAAYAQPSSREVYFQNWSAGSAYSKSMAESDWTAPLHYWDADPNASIKTYDSTNGYKGLRVKMPANTVSSNNGIQFDSKLANGTDYTFEYKVLFESGFEFSRGNSGSVYGGGKLPGIGGGNRPGGGAGASGSQDGMSARMMFRRDPTQSTPYLELYLYWRGQSGTYGDSVLAQTG